MYIYPRETLYSWQNYNLRQNNKNLPLKMKINWISIVKGIPKSDYNVIKSYSLNMGLTFSILIEFDLARPKSLVFSF